MSLEQPVRTLDFRCPKELEEWLPRPEPAIRGLPDWLKEMPSEAQSRLTSRVEDTVKRCPPFIDAMTQGFMIPLMCDLWVDGGEFTWNNDFPTGGTLDFPRSPIGFHDEAQVVGTPFFESDRFLVKFHNLWMIDAPEGYALLFMHPANRGELPFVTLSGLVDCDLYRDSWIHFPAHWRDVDFKGLLPRGTPIAQCIPIKREAWVERTNVFTPDDSRRAREVTQEIARDKGVYRRRYRA